MYALLSPQKDVGEPKRKKKKENIKRKDIR